MKSELRWGALACALAACSAPQKVEQCDNGLDDDENGQIDCQDLSCAADSKCAGDGGYVGSCAKCGTECTNQRNCLAGGYHQDDPIPQCLSGRCTALLEGIDLRFEHDVSTWQAINITPKSMNTRFVVKKAIDGSAVTCASLKEIASSTQSVDADQIERTNRFNLLAFDTTPIAAFASVLIQPFLSTGTGQNFIIWTELWTGKPDSNTKLPTGMRMSYACVESGAEVAPVLTEHHWPSSTPTQWSRTIRIKMPPPP